MEVLFEKNFKICHIKKIEIFPWQIIETPPLPLETIQLAFIKP